VAAVCRKDRGSCSREYSRATVLVRTGSVVVERTCRGRGGRNREYIAEEAVDKDKGSRSRLDSPEAGMAAVLKNKGVVGAGV
jgi:hypothetical protein